MNAATRCSRQKGTLGVALVVEGRASVGMRSLLLAVQGTLAPCLPAGCRFQVYVEGP